jgi:glucose-1-phosphate cytidylyltransferase
MPFKKSSMKTVIMAGGLGTRLQEETVTKPKPMVEVGREPLLWHILNIYSHHGFDEFIIALGYKGDWIKKYFLNYRQLQTDFTVHLKNGNVRSAGRPKDDWTVHLVDTGLHTQTGGRLKRLRSWIGNKTFMMTYGDGVANVDIRKLVEFHQKHGRLATVTAVRPPARFGRIQMEGNRVTDFVEKSQMGEGWINGGFFVLEPEVLELIDDDQMLFEHKPLETLAKKGQLMAYKHEGFWQCVDTLRDLRFLQEKWESGQAPWKVWT